jgi:hypothetical protein
MNSVSRCRPCWGCEQVNGVAVGTAYNFSQFSYTVVLPLKEKKHFDLQPICSQWSTLLVKYDSYQLWNSGCVTRHI